MKNYLILALLVTVTSVAFYSCKKQELFSAKNQEQSIEDNNTLFMKWAQANNGRWLPYTIRSVKGAGNPKSVSNLLDTWAADMKAINVAKAYYRNIIGKRVGLSNVQLDNYLDSLYLRRYKLINGSLKYQKTMDSLFTGYKKLESLNDSNSASVYIPGTATKKFLDGTGSKIAASIRPDKLAGKTSTSLKKTIMGISSDNPSGYYGSMNCIPVELTDWFDQHYDNLYTNIIALRATMGYPQVAGYFHILVQNDESEPCAHTLLNEFFAAAMGFYVVDTTETGAETFGDLTCDKSTENIANQLTAYYSCLQQRVPNDLLYILADGDPFENSFEVYFSDYQYQTADLIALNQIHMDDQIANSNQAGYLCSGAPNMAGWMFFPGVREHMLIQLHYLSLHPTAEREYWIPNTSSNNSLNPGRADIANPSTGEIFEIKPSANQTAMTAGLVEANNYVTKANIHCLSSLNGSPVWRLGASFDPITLPYSATEDLRAVLSEPGLIGYSRIPKSGNYVPVVVPDIIAQKFKSLINRLKSFQNFNNPATAERIIIEFLRQNPEVAGYIKFAAIGAGVGIIVGTIAEDFATAGVGIIDDIPCFVMSYRIIRLATALPL